ncbi:MULTISPECIES: hypothetical protein [Burkholderia cepacia complex]|uniref:hypothetical protein n=1 Tax=Burkholderia cepacia complex TaxID=87882 RepID=UPI000F5A24A2|nr:hypothetical protein [Burkholderia cenocepacia]MBR8073831.1 hypothetical protein [Burkholderia cenocepacia]MBR8448507.1 hypothetical protein [Burkholderia cenocepacia]MBR8512108.1 hypothetical protein [Burkholderia cenocepacia]RQV49386.1 hypothetical protein DF020_34065 [Burkholderia cenocepacia]
MRLATQTTGSFWRSSAVRRQSAIAVYDGKVDTLAERMPQKPLFDPTNENIKPVAVPAVPDGLLPRPCEHSAYA